MNEITTIGLDLAERVFQVHAVDAAGAVVRRRPLVAWSIPDHPCRARRTSGTANQTPAGPRAKGGKAARGA
jgi:hypothetical protein